MCLSNERILISSFVRTAYVKPTEWEYAYKVFNKGLKKGQLRFEIYSYNERKTVPRGRVLRDYSDMTGLKKSTGFHVFKTRNGAKHWAEPGQVIRRVRVSVKLTTGTQNRRAAATYLFMKVN